MATFLQLGRYGDLCNLLPAMQAESIQHEKPTVVASHEFADILDGVTYCTKRMYSRDPNYLEHAMLTCEGMSDLRVSQVHGNPDPTRQRSNYCEEQYRLGGIEFWWRKLPLTFDNRSEEREAALLHKVRPEIKPFISVAIHGVSSPFTNGKHLVESLRQRFPDYKILDLAYVQAEKPFDLLAVLDASVCLVTVDTLHLHLANAARCPTVAILNEGWYGSTPPVTAVGTLRYSKYDINLIHSFISSVLRPIGQTWGVVDRFGKDERHDIALRSHLDKFDHLFGAPSNCRTALSIGDPRPLPFLKDMLANVMMQAQDRDVIVWTNDDVEIRRLDYITDHCRKFGACTVRRDKTHTGRELFAFRKDWLSARIESFPDCIIAAPWFDLAVAAWVRKQMGYVSTFANFQRDLYPCDLTNCNDDYFRHPDHESSWEWKLSDDNPPSSMHNLDLYKQLVSQ